MQCRASTTCATDYGCRSTRSPGSPAALVPLSTEPVDDATVSTCLDVAARATVATPRRCEFLVLCDPDRKHQLARIYREAWSVYRRLLHLKGSTGISERQWEADHFEDVPVVIVACVHGPRPVFLAFNAARYYASVFPALENLLLAAHSLGLGATITTLPISSGSRPVERSVCRGTWRPLVVPIGWPKEPLPDSPAVALNGIVHHYHWGNRTPSAPK